MALRKTSLEIKKKILSVCVRLFIEQGYNNTPINQIIKESGVSASTFQNIFHTKDAVMNELVEFMFKSQFKTANELTPTVPSPVYVYAVETAIQLAIAESNENLREIYIEAYSHNDSLEYIHQCTAVENYKIFKEYFPNYNQSDFYAMDIGTSGIIYGYMQKQCNIHFTFQQKIEQFISLALRCYKIPENDIQNIITYVNSIDLVAAADSIIQKLFAELEMKFNFKLDIPADHQKSLF